jgi:hypothetical protein
MKKAAWIGTMENVIDGLFAVDILYNFRTAYVDDQVPPSLWHPTPKPFSLRRGGLTSRWSDVAQGNVIRDSAKIARNYLRNWFSIDFVASIPFDTLAKLFGDYVDEQITLLAFLKVRSARP